MIHAALHVVIIACYIAIGASIVVIMIHAALHTVAHQDTSEGEIEVTMEEVTIQ